MICHSPLVNGLNCFEFYCRPSLNAGAWLDNRWARLLYRWKCCALLRGTILKHNRQRSYPICVRCFCHSLQSRGEDGKPSFAEKRKLWQGNKSLVDMDLEDLSLGLEGRGNNPLAILYDHLYHPEADTALADASASCLVFKECRNRAVSHVVLDNGTSESITANCLRCFCGASWWFIYQQELCCEGCWDSEWEFLVKVYGECDCQVFCVCSDNIYREVLAAVTWRLD